MGCLPTPVGRSTRCFARRGSAMLCGMDYLFLIAGVVIGTLLGLIVVSMAALGSYDRGFRDGRGIRRGSL